jgi:hypothetical protein
MRAQKSDSNGVMRHQRWDRKMTNQTAPAPAPALKDGTRVNILPAYQDAGDADFEWFTTDDEANGRVSIEARGTGLTFAPRYTVQAAWVLAA